MVYWLMSLNKDKVSEDTNLKFEFLEQETWGFRTFRRFQI